MNNYDSLRKRFSNTRNISFSFNLDDDLQREVYDFFRKVSTDNRGDHFKKLALMMGMYPVAYYYSDLTFDEKDRQMIRDDVMYSKAAGWDKPVFIYFPEDGDVLKKKAGTSDKDTADTSSADFVDVKWDRFVEILAERGFDATQSEVLPYERFAVQSMETLDSLIKSLDRATDDEIAEKLGVKKMKKGDLPYKVTLDDMLALAD